MTKKEELLKKIDELKDEVNKLELTEEKELLIQINEELKISKLYVDPRERTEKYYLVWNDANLRPSNLPKNTGKGFAWITERNIDNYKKDLETLEKYRYFLGF